MKQYKLLKDMPTVKAGMTFREITREVDGSKILKEYESNNKVSILVSKINDFDEWFEEIQEPTDSIHWKPKNGDEYFYISDYGNVYSDIWSDKHVDNERLALGAIYRTEEECEGAKERSLAEARLRRTSTFKPDWNNDNQNKWTVYYDHNSEELLIEATAFLQYSSAIYFDTYDSIKKSIKENREDWLIYFGIEEEI